MNAIKKLVKKIGRETFTYRDFIETSLYDIEDGYYMTSPTRIGRGGDFITTPTLYPIFAEFLASYFIQMIDHSRTSFVFCEIASGTGDFAKMFIKYIEKYYPQIFKEFLYVSVEASPENRMLQREKLRGYNVKYYDTIDELPVLEGIVFSNEWLDAFPCHVIYKNRGKIYEVLLNYKSNRLEEIMEPLQNPLIYEYLNSYPEFVLNEGQRIEIPLYGVETYKRLLKKVKNGLIITIDYGYTFQELRNRTNKKETLRGYKNHQIITNILQHPFEIDITHHIHFDAIRKCGERNGAKTLDLVRQDEFFLKNGILRWLVDTQDLDPFSLVHKRNRAIRSLIDSNGISQSFHVLIQEKKHLEL